MYPYDDVSSCFPNCPHFFAEIENGESINTEYIVYNAYSYKYINMCIIYGAY